MRGTVPTPSRMHGTSSTTRSLRRATTTTHTLKHPNQHKLHPLNSHMKNNTLKGQGKVNQHLISLNARGWHEEVMKAGRGSTWIGAEEYGLINAIKTVLVNSKLWTILKQIETLNRERTNQPRKELTPGLKVNLTSTDREDLKRGSPKLTDNRRPVGIQAGKPTGGTGIGDL